MIAIAAKRAKIPRARACCGVDVPGLLEQGVLTSGGKEGE